MFGSYLGIGNKDQSIKRQPNKLNQKAEPSTKCQKCLQLGHYSFNCNQER